MINFRILLSLLCFLDTQLLKVELQSIEYVALYVNEIGDALSLQLCSASGSACHYEDSLATEQLLDLGSNLCVVVIRCANNYDVSLSLQRCCYALLNRLEECVVLNTDTCASEEVARELCASASH